MTMTNRQRVLCRTFDSIVEADEEISTELAINLTAQRENVEYSAVVDALHEEVKEFAERQGNKNADSV
jgi:hypothetical protein